MTLCVIEWAKLSGKRHGKEHKLSGTVINQSDINASAFLLEIQACWAGKTPKKYLSLSNLKTVWTFSLPHNLKVPTCNTFHKLCGCQKLGFLCFWIKMSIKKTRAHLIILFRSLKMTTFLVILAYFGQNNVLEKNWCLHWNDSKSQTTDDRDPNLVLKLPVFFVPLWFYYTNLPPSKTSFKASRSSTSRNIPPPPPLIFKLSSSSSNPPPLQTFLLFQLSSSFSSFKVCRSI